MKTKLILAGAAALMLGLGGRADASLVTYIGSDTGAGLGDARPLSDAAAVAFGTAASAIGNVSVIDFESATLGSFASLGLGNGVTMTGVGGSVVPEGSQGGSTQLFGYNTTSGGAQFVAISEFPNGSLTFSFSPGINSFGAYISGLQGQIVGEQTVTFYDGSQQIIDIPSLEGDLGGIAFVGFTDAGKDVLSVTIDVSNDIVGVDDVMFGRSFSVVPEPGTMIVWSVFAGIGMVCGSRRSRLAKRA
jgi:hypothetical protein